MATELADNLARDIERLIELKLKPKPSVEGLGWMRVAEDRKNSIKEARVSIANDIDALLKNLLVARVDKYTVDL